VLLVPLVGTDALHKSFLSPSFCLRGLSHLPPKAAGAVGSNVVSKLQLVDSASGDDASVVDGASGGDASVGRLVADLVRMPWFALVVTLLRTSVSLVVSPPDSSGDASVASL
jgi:hypothetical protein